LREAVRASPLAAATGQNGPCRPDQPDVSTRGDLAVGVPELSSWAMMLIGFAGVGRKLRRRDAVAA